MKLTRYLAILAFLAVTVYAQNNCTEQIEQFAVLWPVAVPWRQINGQSISIPPSECGGKDYCSYGNKFTCVDAENSFAPIDCEEAYLKGIFPLCAGQMVVDARCTTWDCCENLNKQAYAQVREAWAGRAVDFNYQMIYTSDSLPINCYSFSPNQSNHCFQWIEYVASSDWDDCLYFQFQYNQNSADEMAFSLF